MYIQQVVNTSEDLIPYDENNTLTVQLHIWATPRYDKALHNFITQSNRDHFSLH
jgi:hypothetical protein